MITFAYLGRVHMSLYTIGCTVSAACTLQIPHLLQMCMDFLMTELNVHTCVYIWNIGAAYGLVPVRDSARRYVLENFAQFAETPQFTQLTLEHITAFLQDDNLILPSEVTTFQVGYLHLFTMTYWSCYVIYVFTVHTNGKDKNCGRGEDMQTMRRG